MYFLCDIESLNAPNFNVASEKSSKVTVPSIVEFLLFKSTMTISTLAFFSTEIEKLVLSSSFSFNLINSSLKSAPDLITILDN